MDSKWIFNRSHNLSLSNKLYISEYVPREGLIGVFYDSLPDGQGRLLVDRMLIAHGQDPASIDVLQRLAIVGKSGHGALEYIPEFKFKTSCSKTNYDTLAIEYEKNFKLF